MRTLRFAYRAVRILLMVYGFWNALLKSRWWTVSVAIYRMLRRRRNVRNTKRVAAVQFVNGGEPAIYRRTGWRRLRIENGSNGTER